MSRALLPEERLEILRTIDTERKWHALDDERVCVICNRVFLGRQIEITRSRSGHYRLQCPTPECPSTYQHWFLSRSPAAASASSRESEFGDGAIAV